MNHGFRQFNPWVVLGVLLLWVLALRWPTFPASLWNVDESIHAAVATTLNDGGVMYRDTIDQRTPLSYQAFRAVFAVAGENNLWAVRAVIAVMIALTAFALMRLAMLAQMLRVPTETEGRFPPFKRGVRLGQFAAVVFIAFSTTLITPSDAFAAHTEWFLIFFSVPAAWATWWLIARPSLLRAMFVGALYGLAFLSKQPALLELAVPFVLFGVLALQRTWEPRLALRCAAGVSGGFVIVVGIVAIYFAVQGALGDAVFYTWTYNVKFYGPEITLLERAGKALVPLLLLAKEYTALTVVLAIGAGFAVLRLVQVRPNEFEYSQRPWLAFLVTWTLCAFAGAASGGRGFEHYAIQCLPPFALLAAEGLTFLICDPELEQPRPSRWVVARFLMMVVAVFVVMRTVILPFRVWNVKIPPPDPAQPAADFIRAHSQPDETIFVWGYNPDVHLYAQRAPASRFVYCSFLTGLIPWTNLAPEKDTKYAIVPGAMNQLLWDLHAKQPVFIVDCSPGYHRNFHKYPLTKFPELERFIAQNYVIVDAGRFVPQGFRVFMIRDSVRRSLHTVQAATTPVETTRRPTAVPAPPPPPVGPDNADLRETLYEVSFRAPKANVTRLELLLDGKRVESVTFPPSPGLRVALPANFMGLAAGRHDLATRITTADGDTATSVPLAVVAGNFAIAPAEQAKFALPTLQAPTAPLTVQAPYGPAVNEADGRAQFYVHAPSRIAYALNGTAKRITGACGILPGAYAPENKSPTDGAGFRIELIAADGKRTVLLERVLRPATNDWERGPQKFSVDLPPHAAGTRLEFTTNAGPADNGACDWTYWNDLLLF